MNNQEAIDLLVSCSTFDCEHCNNRFRGCKDKDKFEDMKNMIISTLQQQLNNGWILVSDRLPDKSGNYLISSQYCLVGEGEYNCEKELFSYGTIRVIDVVAWQHLPDPYTEHLKITNQ